MINPSDVNSTVRDWSDQIDTFESDLDNVFENYFHGKDGENKIKFPEFADYTFETKVYEGMITQIQLSYRL